MSLPVTIAADSGGGSFLVSPNVGLMIWTLLLFGISMYILWKLAFPRISDALDRRHSQGVRAIDCRTTRRAVRMTLVADRDLAVEAHAAEEKGDLFEKVFDRELAFVCRRKRDAGRGAARPTTRPTTRTTARATARATAAARRRPRPARRADAGAR